MLDAGKRENVAAPKAPENFDAFYGRLCELAGASEPEAVLGSLRKALAGAADWRRHERAGGPAIIRRYYYERREVNAALYDVADDRQDPIELAKRMRGERDALQEKLDAEEAKSAAAELTLRVVTDALIAAGAHDLDSSAESTAVTQIEALAARRLELEERANGGPVVPPTFKIGHGLFVLHWKEGGSSLASVGSDRAGNRWYAPTNWISGPCLDWSKVARVVPIDTERCNELEAELTAAKRETARDLREHLRAANARSGMEKLREERDSWKAAHDTLRARVTELEAELSQLHAPLPSEETVAKADARDSLARVALSLCARAPAEPALPVTVEALREVVVRDGPLVELDATLLAVARLCFDAVRAGAASDDAAMDKPGWYKTLCRWYLDTALTRAGAPEPDVKQHLTVAVVPTEDTALRGQVAQLEKRLAKCAEFCLTRFTHTGPDSKAWADGVSHNVAELATELRRLGGAK